MELQELQQASYKRLHQLFGIETKYCKVLPGNWFLTAHIDLKKIKEFQIYEGDVWVITTPKSGITWMQEITWLIMNDLNLQK